MNFNFNDWVRDHDFTTETKKALRSNGLIDTSVLLIAKSGDIRRIGITIGQEIVLRSALASLGNKNFLEPPATTSDPATIGDSSAALPATSEAAQQLGEVVDGAQNTEETNSDDMGAPSTQDPQGVDKNIAAPAAAEDSLEHFLSVGPPAPLLKGGADIRQASSPSVAMDAHDPRVLLTMKASTKKAEKIMSFLPDKVRERIQRRRRDRMVLTHAEDGSLSFKASEEDTYAITVNEWAAANMRLLSHLLRKGDLAYSEVDYYLAYTMQVHELAEKFDWASLMEFDCRYRELQAEHNFRWGDMRFVSQIQLLQPKKHNGPPRRSQGAAAPTNSKEDCKKWLASGGRSCPFGAQCRYLHRKVQDDQVPKNS